MLTNRSKSPKQLLDWIPSQKRKTGSRSSKPPSVLKSPPEQGVCNSARRDCRMVSHIILKAQPSTWSYLRSRTLITTMDKSSHRAILTLKGVSVRLSRTTQNRMKGCAQLSPNLKDTKVLRSQGYKKTCSNRGTPPQAITPVLQISRSSRARTTPRQLSPRSITVTKARWR